MQRYRINGHFAAWFYEETYRENFGLIWPVNDRRIVAFVKNRFSIDYARKDDEFGASVVEVRTTKGHHQVICLREWDRIDPRDVSMLAHECFHAAEHILSKRGIALGDFTTEPYAYMVESIMRRCLILLDTRRKIIA